MIRHSTAMMVAFSRAIELCTLLRIFVARSPFQVMDPTRCANADRSDRDEHQRRDGPVRGARARLGDGVGGSDGEQQGLARLARTSRPGLEACSGSGRSSRAAVCILGVASSLQLRAEQAVDSNVTRLSVR